MTKQEAQELQELFASVNKDRERLQEFVDLLVKRLDIAERVCMAATLYMRHINSPLCIGWDELIDALAAYRKAKEGQG